MINEKRESILIPKVHEPLLCLRLPRIVSIFIGIIVVASGCYAQNTQTNKNKADQNLKSSARVNPATLAMEFDLPLGGYPGRNGQSKPFAFNYSSKVWNLQWFNLRHEMIAEPGNPNYHHIAYYNSEVIAKFAEKSVSGWTSNFRPFSLIRWFELYNSAGGLLETSGGPTGGGNSLPGGLGGWECNIHDEGEAYYPACPSTVGHFVEWHCFDEDHQQTINTQWTCVDIPNGPGLLGMKMVYRFRVELPDGTTQEFRKDDRVRDCALNPNDCNESPNGSYLSVDGSGMRLEIDEVQPDNEVRDVLYMPDGSKYIFPETDPLPIYGKLVDRNGNTSLFDPISNQWTDTLGRSFIDPLNPLVPQNGVPGTYPFTLEGINNLDRTYYAEWKKLGTALEDSQDQLEYLGPDRCNRLEANPVSGDSLFQNQPSSALDDQIVNQIRELKSLRVCAEPYGNSGPSPGTFNPLVLAAVTFPDGSKYEFKYNEYAEITKIIYPTGGYERFEYGYIDPIGYTALEIFRQANRGVHARFVSFDGVAEEQEWTYTKGAAVITTAPDGSRTERFLQESVSSLFGFEDPRNGLANEELAYDAGGALRSRTLTDWTVVGSQGQNGFVDAKRDPRLQQSVTIIFEPGSNKALATLTVNEYDDAGSTDPEFFSHLNVKRSKTYHYALLNKSEVDNEQLSWAIMESWFPESKLATITETDYFYNPDYRARGLASLPIETRILNPSNLSDVLAKTQIIYDNVLPNATGNYPFSIQAYGTGNSMDCSADPQNPKMCWGNPNGPSGTIDLPYRGLPTTTRNWIKETNTWIETHTQYDQFGNVVKVRDPSRDGTTPGNEITTVYSSEYKYAYPTSVTGPAPDPTGVHGTNATSMIQTGYDFTTGLVTSVTDEFGQVTTTTYDSMLRPRFVNPVVVNGNPTGPVTETQYGQPNASGLLVTRDTNGNLTADNRFVKVRRQIDANNWDEATNWFDGLGRTVKTQAKDSQGDVFVETHYDIMGRVDRVTNPYRLGETVYWNKTEYDAAGRPFKTFAPAELNNLGSAQWLSETSFSIFDDDEYLDGRFVGPVVTTKDSSLRMGRSVTNALGQLLRVDEPTEHTGNGSTDLGPLTNPHQPTFYNYDIYGKMVHVQQGEQNRWFKYDSLGRLLRVRQPEQEINQSLDMADPFNTDGDWTAGFLYDILGNVTRATDANGINIINEYDKANRVIRRCYTTPNVTLAASVDTCAEIPDEDPTDYRSTDTPTVEFFYDGKGLSQQQSPNYAKGKLTKVTSSVSETRYSVFDNFGRLKEGSQITDGQLYTSKYIYNLSGALIEEEYPSGRKVKNEFEPDGDLLAVTSRKAGTDVFRQYVSNFSYTASGGITRMRLGNGRWEIAKFNNRLQVEELGLGTSAVNAGLWKVNYAYGELATNGTDVDATKNTGNIAKQTLTIPGATFAQAFRYDSLYRLKQAVEPGAGSTPNWTQAFDYDRYGNRTAFTQTVGGVITHSSTPAVSSSSNRFTSADFEYDKNGNLVGDIDPVTSQPRDFLFNADNKQSEVIVNSSAVGRYFYDGEGKRVKKVAGGETTVFVYSAGKLVAEYSTSGPPATGHINYTTTDHLGSPRIITNELGQVTSRRDFMPFGEDLNAGIGNRTADPGKYSALGDKVRQKFTGYQKDEETKLDFAEARMYENRFGRFTAVDPLLASGRSANPQTFNRFVYVGNNPLLLVDRNGLIWGKSNDGRVRWFAKKLGTGFSEFRPDNWEYLGSNNKIIKLDPNSRNYSARDVPIRPGPTEDSISTFLTGFRQATFDAGTGTLKGLYNFGAGAANAATDSATGGIFRSMLGYKNPFEIERLPVYSATEARFAFGTEIGAMGASLVVGGAFSGRPVSLSVVPEGSAAPLSVTDELQAIVSRVARDIDAAGDSAFTNGQLRALVNHPELRPAFRGNRIDVGARRIIEKRFPQFESNYNRGPDFLDPNTGQWWDITTPGQWQRHLDRYEPNFGPNGTLLRTQ